MPDAAIYPDAPLDIPEPLREALQALVNLANGGTASPFRGTGIDDATVPGYQFKNAGGAGAARFFDGAGGTVLDVFDNAITAYKPLAGTNASFSGTLMVTGATTLAGVNATAINATSLAASGAVSAGTALSSAGTLVVTGATTLAGVNATAISATSLSTSGNVSAGGNVSGVNGTFSGAVSGASGTFSGTLTVGSTTLFVDPANGRVIVGDSSALGSAANDVFTVRGGTSYFAAADSNKAIAIRRRAQDTAQWTMGLHATGSNPNLQITEAGGTVRLTLSDGGGATLSGALSATAGLSGTTGTFSGGISAGASSAFTGGISVVSGGAAVTGSVTNQQSGNSTGHGFSTTRAGGSTTIHLYVGGDDNVYYQYGSGRYIFFDSSGHWRPGTNGSQDLGSSGNRWGTVYAATGAINTSSRVVKHDIRRLDPEAALAAVRATDVVTFRYDCLPEYPMVGFIAEDAPGLLSPDHASATPQTTASVALAAVQALAARLDAVERMV
jgi:hypothetical protein